MTSGWSYAPVGRIAPRELKLRSQCSVSRSADVDMLGPKPERRSMSIQNDHQVSHSQNESYMTRTLGRIMARFRLDYGGQTAASDRTGDESGCSSVAFTSA